MNFHTYHDTIALPFLVKHQLLSRHNRRKRKLGKPPRWLPPLAVEVYYRKWLLGIVAKMEADCKGEVIPQIDRFIKHAASMKTDSDEKILCAFYGTLKNNALDDKVLGHPVTLGKDTLSGFVIRDEGDDYRTLEADYAGSVEVDTYEATAEDYAKLLKWETGKWNYTAVSLKLNSGRVAKVFVIESVFRADSWSDDLSRLMAAFRHTVGDIVPTERLKTLLLNIGQWSSKWNDEQWQQTLHAVLGVSVYGKEDEIGSRIESFVNENTILIKDLEEQVYQDVRLTIERGIRSGDSQRDIMKALLADTELERGVFAKVKTRARLIARDQINKINGDITRSRQEGIGIEEYYWRGVGDSRERDSHYEMNDTLCRWDDADVYSNDDGKTWEDRPEDMKGLIPGEDYQCRCWAEPVFGEEFEYQGEDAAIAA